MIIFFYIIKIIMIIPVKCFTCNSNLSCKYLKYLELTENKNPDTITNENISILKDENQINLHEKAFMILNITRYCCRRHMISEVNIIDKI